MMKGGEWVLFLILLGATWACDARELALVQVLDEVVQLHIQQQGEIQVIESVPHNDNICSLCKEYATEALSYISNSDTQTEIIQALQASCSQVPAALTQKCIKLVDQYVPHFFGKVSSVEPQELCRKISLCKNTVQIATHLHEDKCDMCHYAVSEVLIKLQDPDTQLDILEIILKGCNSVQNYVKKCKKMVFEYGPLILKNAEQFLETKDICTRLHACGSGAKQASLANS